MSKYKIILLCFYSCLIQISCRFFKCTESEESPSALNNTDFSLSKVNFDINSLNPVIISDKVLINNHYSYIDSIKEYYQDSFFCPDNYAISKKEELDTIIEHLGNKTYSTFTDPEGLDMSEGVYYITNTKGTSDEYSKYFMILNDSKIEFQEFDPYEYVSAPKPPKFYAICILKIPENKIIFPDDKRDFDYNTELNIKLSFNGYFSDLIWKVNDETIKKENFTLTLTEPGVNNVQFWGKYVTGKPIYLCGIFYVSYEKMNNSQEFDESKIKKIKTDFNLLYNPSLHFTTSNCPVAPRDDGGYYVAVANTDKILHILSFDKDDNLIKDFDTQEKARPHDITQTYHGFAVYVMDADNRDHSYITVYDKDYQQINRVQIMNNVDWANNKQTDSTPEKQVIRYNSNGKPQFGIRLIYQADNAKLIYSRGRIFLIFVHYNIFESNYQGHTGDTVVTFNDNLEDIDFGSVWGASHSLIQSATFDANYFWTAALSDAYPNGIRVTYTSKKNFQNNRDPVANKHNIRVHQQIDNIAGYIKGHMIGWTDGKLGAILYYEELGLYALVYAKTPDHSDNEKNGKNIIYITTWKFNNGKIEDITTREVKIMDTENIMQVRAGKLGNDKVVITYTKTKTQGHNYYGNIPAGSIPKVYVIKLPDIEIIQDDITINKLVMNTNEELRTFRNGVLIWASADTDNKLVINKIGESFYIPAITWKDIYGLSLEETKTINGEEISGPLLNMRGITNSKIDSSDTFIINLTFTKKERLRSLEDETITMEAICQPTQNLDESDSSINMVDYQCIGKKDSNLDLSGYVLDNIEEGNNNKNSVLEKSNLDAVVSDIKSSGNLDKLDTITSSSFTTAQLNNIVIFKMNQEIKKLSAVNYNFNFEIEGTLDKEITSENSITQNFEINEIDTKASCTFTTGESKTAKLSCSLNAEEHQDILEFSFKTVEIKTENNEIYLTKLNDITLANTVQEKLLETQEAEGIDDPVEEEKENVESDKESKDDGESKESKDDGESKESKDDNESKESKNDDESGNVDEDKSNIITVSLIFVVILNLLLI